MSNAPPALASDKAYQKAVTRLIEHGKKLSMVLAEKADFGGAGRDESRILTNMALLVDALETVQVDWERKYCLQREDSRQTGDEKPDDGKDGKIRRSAESNIRNARLRKKLENKAAAGNGSVAESQSAGDQQNVQRVASRMEYKTSGKVNSTKRNGSAKEVASGRVLWNGDKDILPEGADCRADWAFYWADRLNPRELTVPAQTAWLEVISKDPREFGWERMVPWQEAMKFRDAQKLIRPLNEKRLALEKSRYPLAGEGKDTEYLLGVILEEYMFWWKDRKKN